MGIEEGITYFKNTDFPFECSSNADDSCWTEKVANEAGIFTGGVYLGCAFGASYMYIWAVGILASGQASTMTGTYAGQFCMQGFLKLDWPQWKILVVTRLTAMFPTIIVAAFMDMKSVEFINLAMNAVMFIMLPFAVIPCLTFSSSRIVMKNFKNGLWSNILCVTLCIGIFAINIFFFFLQMNEWIADEYKLLWIPVAIFFLFYASFIVYLSVYMFICLGWESLAQKPFIQKWYKVDGFLQNVEKL